VIFAEKPEWFKGMSVDDGTTAELRMAFHQHMEKHWPEWQEHYAGLSTDRLDDMLMGYTDELDALGHERWRQNRETGAESEGNGKEDRTRGR
jgi:hypothetical protein